MEVMVQFSVALLTAIADFLGSEPMIYLFTVCLLVGIVKVFKSIVSS